ncbi:RNA polymerase sigma-70 factor [Sunxiuqinia elliptica]|uniref:RNA polymerase sigma-70 factor, ECF subfamily n=1 Tax=Sunxiuqinia elliptica TaxID=655355 RepID=A0A1I2KK57_9BACT|nr:RNA polymerase sigma-70 factor [Sunxiuqinia elliptica]SFF67402.1 RNA polymerase sigma-70 factor, ECF subfamily [Sunxiuqinia elliptica]
MMTAAQPIEFFLKDGRFDVNKLFLHYSKPLFYFALKFVDEEQAKDVVQDVFYKLWEDKSLSISGSLNGFLFTMTRNRCLQIIEKQKVRAKYADAVHFRMQEDELLFYSNEHSSLIEAELKEQLEKAIEELPEKCREVFILSRFQNKRNKDIAEELGISVKMVEKHITKALRYIRLSLGDYLPLFLLLQAYFIDQKSSDFFS